MEASHGTEPRLIRLADAPEAVQLDTTDLLSRLEAQAEQIGRLQEKADSFERVARAERDSRRRLAERLRQERQAAESVMGRMEQAEAAVAARPQEMERLEQALATAEQQKQILWAQLTDAQQALAMRSRPFWHRLFGRPSGE